MCIKKMYKILLILYPKKIIYEHVGIIYIILYSVYTFTTLSLSNITIITFKNVHLQSTAGESRFLYSIKLY